ncbi:MAG: hypothetical protein ACI3W6_07295 [Clostridia bacterium]
MNLPVYENIVALGRRFGYSMKDIADAMDVSLGTLYHRRKDPDGFTLRELKAFAAKTGISVGELLTEDREKVNTGVSPEGGCRGCGKEMPLGGCGCRRKEGKRHDDL